MMASNAEYWNSFASLEIDVEDPHYPEYEEPASQRGYKGNYLGSRSRRAKRRLAGRKWISIDSVAKDWWPIRIGSYNVLARCYAQQK